MPWNLLLQVLLPIILTPKHPHADEAHSVLVDAHTAQLGLNSGTSSTHASTDASHETLESVLTRALALQLKAQAISGAAPTDVTQKIAKALSAAFDEVPAP